MNHSVYRILNLRNDRAYIGVASDPQKQISNHFTGSGSKLIYEDAQEYGKEVFMYHVIDVYEDEGSATRKMQHLILKEGALYPNGYNMSLNGYGSKGSMWSAEQRARITGSRNHRSKLTEADAAAIFWDTRIREEISKEYGISKTMITKIKNGKAWKHVTEWLNQPLDHP